MRSNEYSSKRGAGQQAARLGVRRDDVAGAHVDEFRGAEGDAPGGVGARVRDGADDGAGRAGRGD